MGVLDLVRGCAFDVPRPRKVGAQGSPAAKVGSPRSRPPPANLRQGHGDLLFTMDPVDAFTATPKMQGFESPIDLEFENRCFKQIVNLTPTVVKFVCPLR